MRYIRLLLSRVRSQRRVSPGEYALLGRLIDESSYGAEFPVVIISRGYLPEYLLGFLFSGFLGSLCERDDRYCCVSFDREGSLSRIAVPAGCSLHVFRYAGAELGVVDCEGALG